MSSWDFFKWEVHSLDQKGIRKPNIIETVCYEEWNSSK